MADKKPIKSERGNIKEFATGDVVPVKHGGTGEKDFRHKGYLVGERNKKLRTVKCEYNRTTDPTANHDITDGYEVGSRWINTTDKKEWLCVKSTRKSAEWILSSAEDFDSTDTFRFYQSLVDFRYDYTKATWTQRTCQDFRDLTQIVYRYGGSTGDIAGTMVISYDSNYQPVTATMTYADSTVKRISIGYDEDNYLDTSFRFEV